ncbi:hypothetical protein OsJ_34103 [Oryza sativa Japonica Group]|uniref:Uncharacterized protein n=1 Tax=Oryza sativa subsp. japonica TaxID=39947 RepID=B9GB03_ORYSJ|nr:hypothetical protein OsJ_34103 [Oryza sativa Japonica Group]
MATPDGILRRPGFVMTSCIAGNIIGNRRSSPRRAGKIERRHAPASRRPPLVIIVVVVAAAVVVVVVAATIAIAAAAVDARSRLPKPAATAPEGGGERIRVLPVLPLTPGRSRGRRPLDSCDVVAPEDGRRRIHAPLSFPGYAARRGRAKRWLGAEMEAPRWMEEERDGGGEGVDGGSGGIWI